MEGPPEGWREVGLGTDFYFFLVQLPFPIAVLALVYLISYPPPSEGLMWAMVIVSVSGAALVLIFVVGMARVLRRDKVDFGGGMTRDVKVVDGDFLRGVEGPFERFAAGRSARVVDASSLIDRIGTLDPRLELKRSGKVLGIGQDYAIYEYQGVERGTVEVEVYPLARTARLKVARDALELLPRIEGLGLDDHRA